MQSELMLEASCKRKGTHLRWKKKCLMLVASSKLVLFFIFSFQQALVLDFFHLDYDKKIENQVRMLLSYEKWDPKQLGHIQCSFWFSKDWKRLEVFSLKINMYFVDQWIAPMLTSPECRTCVQPSYNAWRGIKEVICS